MSLLNNCNTVFKWDLISGKAERSFHRAYLLINSWRDIQICRMLSALFQDCSLSSVFSRNCWIEPASRCIRFSDNNSRILIRTMSLLTLVILLASLPIANFPEYSLQGECVHLTEYARLQNRAFVRGSYAMPPSSKFPPVD